MPITPALVSKRDFTNKQREHLAKEGKAMPDGSFPIASAGDLKNAIALAGQSKHPFAEVKAHIVAQAKALGLTDSLPDGWVQKSDHLGFRI